MKVKKAKIDRKRPVALLGVKISMAIPICEKDKEESLANNVCRPITAVIWVNGWGDEKIALPEEDRKFINGLPNATAIHKFINGVAKASYNTARKISSERWATLATK